MPDQAKSREMREAPRGIILNAGLLALDNLQSHGMDLGFVVSFITNAPWRMRVDTIGGNDVYALVLRDGDIIGSEDTRELLRREMMTIGYNADSKQHFYTTGEGPCAPPTRPWISDDF